MKKLIIIILPFFLIGQDTNIPKNVQNIINQAIDYYDVSLFQESKIHLLELLHSKEGQDFEAEIRYHLGLASFYNNNIGDAKIQWNKVIHKYPTNVRAQELNRIYSNIGQSIDSTYFHREEDFEYGHDIRTGRLFWTPIYMNEKLIWSELKDAGQAVVYYKKLVNKYEDPKKKFQFLYRIFLLEAGYNSNNYGYGKDLTTNEARGKFIKKSRLLNIKGTLIEMENQITDEYIDQNFSTLIQAYYLAGVRLSNSTLFGGKVKVNDISKPYFDKVIDLTKNNETNIYRIFSQHWLK